MGTVDFDALMGKSCDEAKEPKVWPPGLYVASLSANVESGTADNDKETPFLQVTLESFVPGEDVNMEEYEAAAKSRSKPMHLDYTFWMTEAAEFMYVSFLKTMGINTHGRSYGDCLEEAFGEEVGVYVKTSIGKKSGRPFAQIESFCPAP